MNRDELKAVIREVLEARLEGSAPARRGDGPGEVVASSVVDLVTEREVLEARADGKVLRVAPHAIVTPLARETAERYRVSIEVAPFPAPGAPASQPGTAPREADAAGGAGPIALGSDHAGWALKGMLADFLGSEGGYRVIDLGTHSEDAVDYPDYAHRVAAAVGRGEAWRGIIVDGVGVGSAMAANRHPGVRAAALSGIIEVINAREHNDANVLCLGGRMIGDLLARALTVTFLSTAFAGGRHARRVRKIEVD